MQDNTGQIIDPRRALATVESLLKKNAGKLAQALPKHIDSARFMRIVLTSVRKNPDLAKCSIATLLACMMEATALGLEIGTGVGHCWILPFRNHGVFEAKLLLGYKGIIDLAYRSEKIALLQTMEVYEGDTWDYEYGTKPFLRHRHTPDTNWGNMIAAYAMSRTKDGDLTFEVMERKEIDSVRARSRASNNGPWVTDPGMMARKTVAKRRCKMLPCSAELGRAIALDDAAEGNLAQVFEAELELDDLPPQREVPQIESKRSIPVVVTKPKPDEPPDDEPPPIDVPEDAAMTPPSADTPTGPSRISAAVSRKIHGDLRAIASQAGVSGSTDLLTRVVKRYIRDLYGCDVADLDEAQADEALTRADAEEKMLAAAKEVT